MQLLEHIFYPGYRSRESCLWHLNCHVLRIDTATPRLEIGATWYAARVQRSPVNTEAKSLLLAHAFNKLDCVAVEFRTHFMNSASRHAIERLGAKFDGVLRNHQRMNDGTLRDTCVYSVIAPEWPTVRSHLAWQLEKPRGGAATV